MTRRDLKTTVVATAFCGVLIGAVLAVWGSWAVATGLVLLGLWLVWDVTAREEREP